MSRLFPFRREPDLGDREPVLVELDEERADEVFDALGSRTARELLSELHDDPRPASELDEALDTSLQNVQYHLTKLEAADLIEVADTWFAENGTEMKVYAPTDEALVLFAGTDPTGSLKRLLARLLGAMIPVLVLAVGVAWLFDRNADQPVSPGGTGAPTDPNASLTVTKGVSGVDPVLLAVALVGGGLVALGALFLLSRFPRR